MAFRQKFLGYSGGLMVVFGLMMTILGQETAYLQGSPGKTVNAAAGVPMWCGILIIMCGMGNVVSAFQKQKKKSRPSYELPFSFSVLLANMVALVVSAVCIGLLSWSLYDGYFKTQVTAVPMDEAVVGVYATIIIAACFIFIFAFMSLFIDCCMHGFIGFGMPMMAPYDQRESPYDTYNRPPAALYKA